MVAEGTTRNVKRSLRFTMSKDKAPPELEKSKTYNDWRKLINLWTNFTSLPKAKQASAIIMTSLTAEAQEACLEIPDTDINSDDGVAKVLDRLDLLYKKDKLIEKIEAIDAYENFSRPADMDIKKYIIEFEKRYTKILNSGSTVSDDLLAYRLMERANLSKSSNKLLRATAEFKFDDMKKKLKSLFLNDESTASASASSSSTSDFRFESINLLDIDETHEQPYEETFYYQQHQPRRFQSHTNNRGGGHMRGRIRGDAHRGAHNSRGGSQMDHSHSSRGNGRGNQRGGSRGGMRGNSSQVHSRDFRGGTRGGHNGGGQGRVNVPDSHGNPTQCNYCGDIRHYSYNCPQLGNVDTLFTSVIEDDNVDDIVLFESDHDDPKGLLAESWNCGVLDCGAGKTVSAQKWLDVYTDSLGEDDKQKIVYSEPESRYRFGDGVIVTPHIHVQLPASIGTHPVFIGSDVVPNDIPLLFSRTAMAKAEMCLSFKDDTLSAYDQSIKLPVTKTGHYLLPLTPAVQAMKDKIPIEINIASADKSIKSKNRHLHRQFAHPPAEKLKRFLTAAGEPWASDEELKKEITKVSESCRTCQEYGKPSPRPIVGFPMATRFLQCVAMDLKFYDDKILLHLIDHASRLSISTRIPCKKPAAVLNAIFKNFIAIFGSVEKFLTDNGGEFVNPEFVEMCEKFNVNIKTTPAESPWSNGMVERHNAIIAGMLDKVLADTSCNFDIALAWCINAKNSMINVHGFTPYQLAFGKNPTLPTAFENLPPANSPVDHSKILKENLDALHSARETFVKLKNSERLKRALSHNVRTSNDAKFTTGDVVYYKRESDRHWKGKATVLGQDGKQVLLKHGGYHIRCHACRVVLDRAYEQEQVDDIHNDMRNNNNNIVKPSDNNASSHINESDDSDSDDVVPHAPSSQTSLVQTGENVDNYMHLASPITVNLGNVSTQAEGISVPNEQQLTSSAAAPLDDKKKSKLTKDLRIRLKFHDEDKWYTATVIRRTGKVGGKYSNSWDIMLDSDGKHYDVNFDQSVSTWQVLQAGSNNIINATLLSKSTDEFLVCQTLLGEAVDAVTVAKGKELSTWIEQGVYEEVEDVGQDYVSTRWVITEKTSEESQQVVLKARLCARVFEEEQNFRTDSPTCSRESVRILFSILASHNWKLSSIDVTRAFLQGEAIERTVYLKPPPEANTNKLWRLKKCVYGLADAPRKWYLRLTQELKRLGCTQHKIDKGLFVYTLQDKLVSVLTCCVDDIAYGSTPVFCDNVLNTLQQTFDIGTFNSTAFKYVGISITQNTDFSISINQINYINTIQIIPISNTRRKEKLEPVTESERKQLRCAIGQLNWAAGITRPDISFAVCRWSTQVNSAIVNDLIEANKLIKYIQTETLVITFPKLDLDSLHLTLYCDASFKNLPDGGSQGGHIVFLCDDFGNCSPIAWSSVRIKRVVHSTLAAETLSLTDGTSTALYILSLLKDIVPCRQTVEVLTDNKSI